MTEYLIIESIKAVVLSLDGVCLYYLTHQKTFFDCLEKTVLLAASWRCLGKAKLLRLTKNLQQQMLEQYQLHTGFSESIDVKIVSA